MPRWMLATAAILAAVLPVHRPSRAADLEVQVEGLRSRTGVVRLALYDKDEGFATADGKIRGGLVAVGSGPVAFTFVDLAPGTYAVSIYHDENDNDEFDFTWLGLPDEGFGFSNDARAVLSAPSFRDAAVDVGPGKRVITIKLSYW